jgi:hypothetical protein
LKFRGDKALSPPLRGKEKRIESMLGGLRMSVSATASQEAESKSQGIGGRAV